MNTPTKKAHGHHRTGPKGTAHPRKKAKKTPLPPPDPPKPADAVSRPLTEDPVHGPAFKYDYKITGPFDPKNPKNTQKAIAITSPARWEAEHLVTIKIAEIPNLNALHVHRLVAPQFIAFFKAAAAKGLAGQIVDHASNWSIAKRTMGGSTKLSNHAFGTAIDLNSSTNPQHHAGVARGKPGSLSGYADICTDFGLFWGDWYEGTDSKGRSLRDPMHFEAVHVLSNAEMQAACKKYGVDPKTIVVPEPAPPKPSAHPKPAHTRPKLDVPAEHHHAHSDKPVA